MTVEMKQLMMPKRRGTRKRRTRKRKRMRMRMMRKNSSSNLSSSLDLNVTESVCHLVHIIQILHYLKTDFPTQNPRKCLSYLPFTHVTSRHGQC